MARLLGIGGTIRGADTLFGERVWKFAGVGGRIFHLANYILAMVVARQILADVHRRFGGFIHPGVRKYLVKVYMQHGFRLNWRELLVRNTGSDLDSRYLVSWIKSMRRRADPFFWT